MIELHCTKSILNNVNKIITIHEILRITQAHCKRFIFSLKFYLYKILTGNILIEQIY